MKKILCCGHEWSNTGAPLVLASLANRLCCGYEVGIVAGKDYLFAMDKMQPDLVIANSLLAYPAVIEAGKRNIPVLWWLHEGEWARKVLWQHEMKQALWNLIAHNRPGALVASTDYIQKLYSYNAGEPRLIKYAVEKTLEPEIKTVGTVAPSKLRFMVAGTVEARKGQDRTLVAYQKLLTRIGPDKTELVLIGTLPNTPYAQQILGWVDSIPSACWLAPVSPRAFGEVLAGCDVLLCPSRDEGGYPQVLLQAQERAKLVLASDVCGMWEQVHHGQTGMLCTQDDPSDWASRMEVAIKYPVDCDIIAKQARVWTHKNNSYEEHMQKWTELIKEYI
jgi:glycosyltransferase involved in cell wall biosynthesis